MNEAAGTIIVYTTFPNENDARNLGGALVEMRLAACVNIFPGMISIYRWEDKLENTNETAMIVKTNKDLQAKVIEAIAARHPYTVPALIVFEPGHVAAAYSEWLHSQTAAPTPRF
jgi:periplasmic divalent cation tolerance protein